MSRVLMYCSQFHQNDTLHPVREQLERAFRFERNESNDSRLEKLHGVLEGLGLSQGRELSVLERLLSLPGRGDLNDLTPEQLRNLGLESLSVVLEAMASSAGLSIGSCQRNCNSI